MDEEILQEFLAESWENLSRLDTEIVALEKTPHDAALLASIFRTIHTIKGTCGFIGLNRLGAVAHSAENVLGRMRDGVLDVTPSTISLVLQGVDRVKELLGGLESTGSEPVLDSSSLISELDALAEGQTTASVGEVITPSSADVSEKIEEEAIETDDLLHPEPTTEASDVVESNTLDAVETERRLSEKTGDGARKSVADLSIRVNVDVLDSLMNLVGELVLTRNQLLQMVRGEDESKYAAPVTHLNRVTTDLQEGVMKTRMQPIGNAWGKLPRLVRDLAQTMGKQIELQMQGAETELDRTVLDAIKDPLTHMVRNSADHGLESSEARLKRGKPEVGTIRLHAFHEGGHVIICIEDDGAGIDVERIKNKAIKSGLVSEVDASRLSDKEILAYIFQPGFSTAEKISSVSGRGVGMDVVKTQIERIGGTVDLTTKLGQGTTVRIKIPLTLAIISALVVESGGLSFAIPQLGVVELVRLAAEDRHKIEHIHQNEVFRLRNRLLPLVYLNEALGLPEHDASREQDVNIVVVQVGDDQMGLIVSEVFDTEEIVVKPVGNLLKDIDIYQGTTILGDGRVIMILDVSGIASQFSAHPSSLDKEQQRIDQESEAKGPPTSLLLFNAGDDTTMSVPLSLVARLEEIPRNKIEKTGERLVVQYRGDLLPLIPLNSSSSAPDPQPVIVFSEGDRSMGLMVEQIQDIIEERLVIRMQSRRTGVLGTAIINGAATDILDIEYYVRQADPSWFQRKRSQHAHRVLVVDDSIFFRQLLSTCLETEGYRVVTVESAIQAVERIEHGQRFDLIVSDIDMPAMDGFEFAEWVRGRPGERIPMMAVTAMAGASYESRACDVGFDRFEGKFDATRFLEGVRELCQSKVNALTGATV